MAGSAITVNASTAYRAYGDTAPSFEALLPLYERQLHSFDPIPPLHEPEIPTPQRPPHRGSGVFRDIVLGDLCRDIADSRREQRDQWLGRAKSHLRDARDIGQHWVEQGAGGPTDELHQNVAAAALRLIDSDAWEAALDGKPVGFNYEVILKSCVRIYEHVDHRARGVEDVMAEALPMIAAAREGVGAGRHALLREDQQAPLRVVKRLPDDPSAAPPSRRYGPNPRWDCSLTRSNDPNDLVRPPRRLQVKQHPFYAGTGTSANAYLSAGILPVCTARLGWTSPRAVIASCAIEQGMESPRLLQDLDPAELMTSMQLDYSFGSAMHYLLDASIEEVAEAVNQ